MGVVNLYKRVWIIEACSFPYRRMRLLTRLYGNTCSHCASAGAGDIVDGNLKLILGLIWTLILHYQISMGFGLDDQPKGGPTPKQALLNWINVSIILHEFTVYCVAGNYFMWGNFKKFVVS